MRPANPYADLRSLLDVTRQLSPEEMAELHLEQGFVDRALRIYDELVRREPANASYATRRAWLARIASASRRDGERRPTSSSTLDAAPYPAESGGAVRLVVRAVGTPSSAGPPERTLHGVGPIAAPAGAERAGRIDPAPADAVRAVRIVRVR